MEYDENVNHIFKIKSLEDSCRICITSNSEMSELFNGNNPEIIGKIEYCSGILLTQDKGLPTQICTECLQKLTAAYDFKTKCIFTDNLLRNINKTVKTEFIYHDEDKHVNESCTEYELNVEIVKNEDVEQKIELRNFKRKPVKRLKQTKTITKRNGPRDKVLPKKKIKEKSKKITKKTEVFNKFHCRMCNIKFENKKHLLEHRKEEHSNKNNFICEICGKVYSGGSYRSHLLSHRTPRYKCDHCDYGTSNKGDLIKHIARHFVNTKTYQCDVCTRAYYTCSSLYAHKRLVHEGQRRFPCTVCDKRFNDRSKLTRHIDSHNGVKKYECEVCHSCYTRRCYLKAHLLKQHNIETPRMKPGKRRVVFDNNINK